MSVEQNICVCLWLINVFFRHLKPQGIADFTESALKYVYVPSALTLIPQG